MRKVEIDDEVFELVQRRAGLGIDNFNSALRRLLFRDQPQSGVEEARPASAGGEMQAHPVDIAERLFGRENGVEIALPRRGETLRRPPPDLNWAKSDP